MIILTVLGVHCSYLNWYYIFNIRLLVRCMVWKQLIGVVEEIGAGKSVEKPVSFLIGLACYYPVLENRKHKLFFLLLRVNDILHENIVTIGKWIIWNTTQRCVVSAGNRTNVRSIFILYYNNTFALPVDCVFSCSPIKLWVG